jgi:hypothetical protein
MRITSISNVGEEPILLAHENSQCGACRTCMKRVIWLGDSERLSDGPYVELLQAFLSRLARDPSVLTLTPEEIKGNQEGTSRHKGTGAVCQGCPSCNGPSWHFKTESVAAIWTICCKSAAHECVRLYTLKCKSAYIKINL